MLPTRLITVTVALAAAAGAVIAGTAPAAGSGDQPPPGRTTTTSHFPAGAPSVVHDVRYGTDSGQPLLLDVYLPPGPAEGARRPAVLLIHGGGWAAGDKSGAAPEGMALAARGFVGFSINYRISGPGLWPAELEDTQRALRWVQDNATTYGVDPARVGAFGGSAGGNLAMLLGTDGPGDSTHKPLLAVVSWSGPSDLITLAPPDQPRGGPVAAGTTGGPGVPPACVGDPNCVGTLDPDAVANYMGCSVDDCEDQYRAASPALQANGSSPPMQLASSQQDFVPIEQSYEMADALTRAGVKAEVLTVPGDRHADAYADVATQPMIDFLTAYVANGAGPKVATGASTTTWLPPGVIGAVPSRGLGRLARPLAAIVAVAGLVLAAEVAIRRRRNTGSVR